MTRVYLATTLLGLARLHTDGVLRPGDDVVAHAVTPALREWYIEGDLEELEYAALRGAARQSLTLLAAASGAARRRVVLAADVADDRIVPDSAAGRSRVRLTAQVPLSAVASAHVDEPEAEETIAAAVRALAAAEAGDQDASFTVDEAEACDLLWYDVTEIVQLVS
jgi:hypothetical protein